MEKLRTNITQCAAALLLLAGQSSSVRAVPAQIELTTQSESPVVILGGSIKIQAFVENTAPAGADDLNYTIKFDLPYETRTSGLETLAPGGDEGFQVDFDSSKILAPFLFGSFPTTVSVDAPNAMNNPVQSIVNVLVLNPVTPLFVFLQNGVPELREDMPIPEPGFSPEQFAAIGGGESFAASAPRVVGDPPFDAALDFDTLEWSGDDEIFAKNITFFMNVPAIEDGQDPLVYGISLFDVYLDTSRVGTFTKTFILGFSDEDLPGARAPGSIKRYLTYTFQVVPEPASLALIAAAAVLCSQRRLISAGL